jgi:hypothetical protein
MTRSGPGDFRASYGGPWRCFCWGSGPGWRRRRPAPEANRPAAKAPWTAPDQEAALERAEVVPFVEAVMDECRLCRQQRLRDMGLGVKDQTDSYFLLDSPIIRKKTEDHYGPVRFMHAKHARSPRTAPCATTIGPWTRRIGNHPLFGLPPGAFQKGPSRAAGAQGRLSPAVHGLPSGDEQGAHRLHPAATARTFPTTRTRSSWPPIPEPSQVTRSACAATRRPARTCSKRPTGCGKGPSPYTLNHRKEVELGKAPLPPTTSE